MESFRKQEMNPKNRSDNDPLLFFYIFFMFFSKTYWIF